MPVIERTVDIQAPIGRVFAFATDARNHSLVAPPETKERLLDPGDNPLRLGSIVRFSARFGLVRWTLSSRITAFIAPDPAKPVYATFQDQQVRGPFSVWIHDHIYEATAASTTRVTDRFTYSAPLGPLGWIADQLWLTSTLSRFMEYFQEAEKRILEMEVNKVTGPQ